jgi:hypothetical protein
MTDIDERVSLVWCRINYSRKRFYSSDPWLKPITSSIANFKIFFIFILNEIFWLNQDLEDNASLRLCGTGLDGIVQGGMI